MAARLPLMSGTLPFLWNISARVGPSSDCPNGSTDIELMKLLLIMAQGHPQVSKFGIANGNQLPPPRDTQYDAILGFWIFRFQQLGKMPVVDGFASPARGATFAPGSPWVIGWFNHFARETDPELWNNLPNNTTVSPALKAELTR
ncbi:hypothetical protein [Arvimicrobium flavum]|uniref:hypothetical protein n=1 Tax=Arvimicrobium flavum TaxID=3393320 RepID=UPI00237B1AF7|nr:hypothetical protein [Mesorhizobium shangrilense]